VQPVISNVAKYLQNAGEYDKIARGYVQVNEITANRVKKLTQVLNRYTLGHKWQDFDLEKIIVRNIP